MTHPQVKDGLRFAMYVRVSTDEQREYGKSLAAQRAFIQAAVGQLGGKIVAEYGGSEHATPGYERDEFERMLADAEAVKFDSICMTDSTRWARDTVTSKLSVRRLKHKRIRLFFGAAEQDLRSATVQFALTIKTESTELETGERHDRGAFVRIKQAALGFVTSGHPPYGRFVSASLRGTRRIWEENPDGTAKWQVDPQAKRYIERAAKLYLAGAGMPWARVAEAVGDDENTVRRRVAAAGAQWQQKFTLRDYRPEDFASIPFYDRLSFEGDHVTVTIPIPPLLDEVTLNRVRAKAVAHYAERAAPNKQVLGGYLRCANCGGSIGTHYHRHKQTGAVYLQHNGPRLPGCPGSFGRYEPVARRFFYRIGVLLLDPVESEAAVRAAVLEETTRQPGLEHELREARAEYAALKREHDGLYAKMKAFDPEEGGATMSRFKADMNQLDAQLRAKGEQVKEREAALKVTRLPEDFSERVAFTLFCLRGYGTNNRWLSTWPPTQRHEMLRFLFGHPSRKPPSGAVGAQTGIYLTRTCDKQSGKTIIEWVAKGWFPQVSDTVWQDPKVAAHFRPAAGACSIDRARLVQLIRRLDIGQFRFARLMFNVEKPEGRRSSV
jgi:DNA invertase Pin-like site-specific DNA recombinase